MQRIYQFLGHFIILLVADLLQSCPKLATSNMGQREYVFLYRGSMHPGAELNFQKRITKYPKKINVSLTLYLIIRVLFMVDSNLSVEALCERRQTCYGPCMHYWAGQTIIIIIDETAETHHSGVEA
jgi:hypothetical protein